MIEQTGDLSRFSTMIAKSILKSLPEKYNQYYET